MMLSAKNEQQGGRQWFTIRAQCLNWVQLLPAPQGDETDAGQHAKEQPVRHMSGWPLKESWVVIELKTCSSLET